MDGTQPGRRTAWSSRPLSNGHAGARDGTSTWSVCVISIVVARQSNAGSLGSYLAGLFIPSSPGAAIRARGKPASASMKATQSLRRRVPDGAKIGLRVAVVFSTMALIAFLLGGNDALARKQLPSMERLVSVYILGGLIAGAVGGALAPFVTSNARAAVSGAIAMSPVALLLRAATYGFAPWTARDSFVLIVLSVFLGGTCGIITRRTLASKSRSTE